MKKLLLLSILLINFNAFTADYTVKMLNQGPSGVMFFEPSLLKINNVYTVNFFSTYDFMRALSTKQFFDTFSTFARQHSAL